MRCGQCGAENPDHYSFCHQCGQALAAPLPSPRPGSRKALGIILGIGLGVLFLIAAVAGIGYWGYKTWKERQKEAYSQQESGAEEGEEEPSGTAPRRSSGSQRISDAQYYEDRRQWDQAIAEYQKILQEGPESYEAHYGLGNCYRKKHDLPAAMSEYQEAIGLNPKYIPARRALARLYARQGNLDAAVEQLEAAQQVAPQDPQVANELANYRKRRAQKSG